MVKKNKLIVLKKLKILMLLLGAIMMVQPTFAQKKKRKRGEPSKIKKFYHNLTHEFNGYFNAKLKLDEAQKQLTNTYQENYNKTLPLYRYMAVDDPASVVKDLDVAIEKAAVAIELHGISKWADDSYLLIGQSQYLRRDYDDALATFGYIISEYDPVKLAEKAAKSKRGKKKKKKKRKSTLRKKPKPKKETPKKENTLRKKHNNDKKSVAKRIKARNKKKKLRKVKRPRDAQGNLKIKKDTTKKTTPTPVKVKPKPATEEVKIANKETKPETIAASEQEKAKSYFLKHRPIHQDAQIWLARTYIEKEKYSDALIVLSRLANKRDLHKSIRPQIAETEAYVYLKRQDYERAIPPLERALAASSKRKSKVRYAFIIAQLHQAAGRGNEAYAAFQRVLDLNPVYEMQFNAQLSIAKNSWTNGEASMDEAVRTLEKMLKDIKNEEYQDQIYFALAEIELKRKNREIAKTYLEKSVQYNSNNKAQKAESYLMLATLYYEDETYTRAKYYYDSTMTVMNKKDERYDEVKRFSTSLTDIAKNIETIELQDSLLRISKMSKAEQYALAIKIKEAEKQAAPNNKKANNIRRANIARRQLNAVTGGRLGNNKIPTWWAYDASALKKGKRDFTKKWGTDRKLSDNWRRSKRRTLGDFDDETEENNFDNLSLTTEEVAQLLKKMGIPSNETQVKAANEKIVDAMAALGLLYRERLQNNQKSIDILEQLMNRYPKNKHRIESAYILHILYKEVPNLVKSDFYKNLVLTDAKGSKYANAITDPNFLQKANQKQVKLVAHYDNAYTDFSQGQYKAALAKIDQTPKIYGKNHKMKPKFALLAAMCVGSTDGKDAYKIALNDVVKTYPKSEEQKTAKQILQYLNQAPFDSKKPKQPRQPVQRGDFVTDDNGTHFIIATYTSTAIKRDELKGKLSDYNKKYYRLQRLRVNTIFLNLQTPLVVIKRFKGKIEAMKYYNGLVNNLKEFVDTEGINFIPMVMPQKNYKTIIRKKNLKAYEAFFKEMYLGE